MTDRTTACAVSAASLGDQIDQILDVLRSEATLSDQSLPRVEDLAWRFGRFAGDGLGHVGLAELNSDEVRRFVEASSDLGPVSPSTMHLRRAVLRLVFRTGRGLGLLDGDPTLDLELPRKSPLKSRPLDDAEVALCRSASLHTLTSTRLAAAWALAEATARTAEIPRLTVADVDLESSRVWIHGGGRTVPRWGRLTPWGVAQLSRRLEDLASKSPDQRVVYRGNGSAQSQQATACMVIGEAIARAGLSTEPDVRPLSVAAWAGRQVLQETGRIDEVARRLGMASLDRAARLIDFDWANG